LQSSGRGQGLVDVGVEERLQTRPHSHIHTGTDVEVGVYEEGKTAQKTPSGAAHRVEEK